MYSEFVLGDSPGPVSVVPDGLTPHAEELPNSRDQGLQALKSVEASVVVAHRDKSVKVRHLPSARKTLVGKSPRGFYDFRTPARAPESI